MMRYKRFVKDMQTGVGVVLALVSCAWACSEDPSSPSGAAGAGGTSSGGSGGSGGSPGDAAADAPLEPWEQCVTKGDECLLCCTELDPTGYLLVTAAFYDCLCDKCAGDCGASACYEPGKFIAPDEECTNCVEFGACASQAYADCDSHPVCSISSFRTCHKACPGS